MKCWHLVAALALAGCGLNTTALPSRDRQSEDAGVGTLDKSIAGSPASWPTRRRPVLLEQDGGTGDTKDAAKLGGGGPTTDDRDAQTDAASSGQTDPNLPAPGGQPPASGGASKPGSQAQPPPSGPSNGHGGPSNGGPSNGGPNNGGPNDGPSSGNGTPGSGPSIGQNGASSNTDAGIPNGSDDRDDDNEDAQGNGNHGGQRPGAGPSGNSGSQPQNADAVSGIVDLVIAILDLSLGPVRPAEIEGLVSAILVLSLAPAELAAESLIAVLDALDDAQICADHPERCNPLCTNLESDCSACGRDEDCIERIEETCKVKLPRTCR